MDVEFFELDGQVLFGGGRGDLAAVHGCLQMDLHVERPVRSASGPPEAARKGLRHLLQVVCTPSFTAVPVGL